ncbi:unnamed protein product [Pleuronectes platessa]|uniref:Uncharacterized protein n=1 Tax=Pleuronectes platessa TaxID=8262 RepID=A0A9N7YTR0_PLEPL|nr:unnamed protein product [Pleuronectes platessa]
MASFISEEFWLHFWKSLFAQFSSRHIFLCKLARVLFAVYANDPDVIPEKSLPRLRVSHVRELVSASPDTDVKVQHSPSFQSELLLLLPGSSLSSSSHPLPLMGVRSASVCL